LTGSFPLTCVGTLLPVTCQVRMSDHHQQTDSMNTEQQSDCGISSSDFQLVPVSDNESTLFFDIGARTLRISNNDLPALLRCLSEPIENLETIDSIEAIDSIDKLEPIDPHARTLHVPKRPKFSDLRQLVSVLSLFLIHRAQLIVNGSLVRRLDELQSLALGQCVFVRVLILGCGGMMRLTKRCDSCGSFFEEAKFDSHAIECESKIRKQNCMWCKKPFPCGNEIARHSKTCAARRPVSNSSEKVRKVRKQNCMWCKKPYPSGSEIAEHSKTCESRPADVNEKSSDDRKQKKSSTGRQGNESDIEGEIVQNPALPPIEPSPSRHSATSSRKLS